MARIRIIQPERRSDTHRLDLDGPDKEQYRNLGAQARDVWGPCPALRRFSFMWITSGYAVIQALSLNPVKFVEAIMELLKIKAMQKPPKKQKTKRKK